MNPTKLSFESENLSIHYICFNIKGFIELEDLKKTAFHQFDYNPQIKSFWIGTKIHFSGDNENQVYNQVKKTYLIGVFLMV